MKLRNRVLPVMMASLIALPMLAEAADGNWKRGRIYYRMVCTACHVDQAGGSISPATMTKAEWAAYIDADKHAKGKDTFRYQISRDYRESIKDSNRAANKFLKLADDDLLADVRAFVIHGAKDSDTPARCN